MMSTTAVSSVGDQPCLAWTPGITKSFKEVVLQRLHQFQQQSLLCDATLLAVDGQSQPVHAVVLAAASPVFQHHLAACQPGTYWIETDLNALELHALVYFIYTGYPVMGVEMDRCLTSFQLLPREDSNHNVMGAEQWTECIWEQMKYFYQRRFLCDATVVDSHGRNIPLHGCILGCLSHMLRLQLHSAACWQSPVVLEVDDDVTALQQLVSNLYDSVDFPMDFDPVCPALGIDANTVWNHYAVLPPDLSLSQCSSSPLTFLENMSYGGDIKPGLPFEGEKTSCYMYDLAFPGDIAPVVSAVYRRKTRLPTCKLCGDTFQQKSELMKHRRRVHPSTYQKKYQCQHCSRTFHGKRDRAVHESGHTGIRPFKCHFCERTYSCTSHLKRHERTHTGIKPAVCPICFSCFNTAQEMTSHVRIHTGERPFSCQHCDKTFYASSSLARHVLTHTGVKDFMCDHCGKAFASNAALVLHSRTHTNDKPYPCQFCQKCFRSSGHARRHERLHTGHTLYHCRVCSKAFTSNSNRRTHEQCHSEDKPYQCSYCDRTFRVSRYVTEHERTHTGVRPFKCRYCDKQFSASGARSRHEKSHTGEKAFNCSKCQKAFSTRSHTTRHERTCKH